MRERRAKANAGRDRNSECLRTSISCCAASSSLPIDGLEGGTNAECLPPRLIFRRAGAGKEFVLDGKHPVAGLLEWRLILIVRDGDGKTELETQRRAGRGLAIALFLIFCDVSLNFKL